MIVTFLLVGEHPKYVGKMVECVRNVFPMADIYQLTDRDTAPVDGTRQIRHANNFNSITVFKMNHLSQLNCDTLFLDTDVFLQRDVSPVFSFDFDVALTWRSEKIVDPAGTNITEMMPYNTGVSFQHDGRFWKEAVRWCADKDIGWYADQIAVSALAPHFNVLKLHCDNFNYTPRRADEDLSSRYAVHYKGRSRHLLDAIL